MPITSPLRILISGAGIAGPTLAHWLTQTSLPLSITILERSPVPRTTGQSIDIRGSAINIIRKMGLEEEIRKRHTTEEGTRFVDANGVVVAEFKKGREGGGMTAEYEILRGDLCGLLMDATRSLPNVTYRFGEHITSLQAGSAPDSPAIATLSTGAVEPYDILIASDGSRSQIRQMILPAPLLQNSYHFIGQYTAFFSIPSSATDTPHWKWFTTPTGLALMTRPHRNPDTIGCYMCITTSGHGVVDPNVEAALDAGIDAQKRVLGEKFDGAGWESERILASMRDAGDFYMSRAATVSLPTWHSTSHNAVLIGDAAFATFGIGTSLAIQSAYTLAGELSNIMDRKDIPGALGRYEKEFRKTTDKSGSLPWGFPQIAFPRSKLGLGVRDWVLWGVSKSGMLGLLPDGDREDESKLKEYQWQELRS